ncbi:MAG: hypothetical protein R3B95_08230 [Nitrospirales bacterium]|nr:hypothetical protein [Nitrospirales bacterium]
MIKPSDRRHNRRIDQRGPGKAGASCDKACHEIGMRTYQRWMQGGRASQQAAATGATDPDDL